MMCVGIDSVHDNKLVIHNSSHVKSADAAVNEIFNQENVEKREFGMGGMAFPDSQALLNLPYFWIADTAASTHMTPHKVGMVN